MGRRDSVQEDGNRVLHPPSRLGNGRLLWQNIWLKLSLYGGKTPGQSDGSNSLQTTGPIPVAAYMRQCLTSPDDGYYTSGAEGRDQFGIKGDFVTSPEISQVFGELVGLWIVAEWMAQGKKSSGVHIIEVGPGRGTLMNDMLRTLRNFKPLADSIETIYLVEASKPLREAQHKLLCGDAPLEDTEMGHQSTSKYSPGQKIIWCEDMKFIPKGRPPFTPQCSTCTNIARRLYNALHSSPRIL